MHPENEEKSTRDGTNEDRHMRLQYRYQSHSAVSLENPRQRLKDLEHIHIQDSTTLVTGKPAKIFCYLRKRCKQPLNNYRPLSIA